MALGRTGARLGGVVLALDVDGVLVDPTAGGRGGWCDVVSARYDVDAAQLQSIFFARAWADVIVGRTAIEPALAAALEELRWPMTAEVLLTCWFEADSVVDQEVVGAARSWADDGARIVLVTNQEHRRARFLAERLGASLPISAMAYSAALGCVKTDPAFFPAACRLAGIDEHDDSVVFVDDAPENVGAARRFGWTAVHFRPDDDWRTEIDTALTTAARRLPDPS
jgi:putative hydrolase of the HAD superfamily